eukprot:12581972-Ditylum_brightwellii.AAC.1
MRSFYIMYQQDDITLEKYMESFVNSIDVVNHSDGIIREHPKLGKYILKIDGNEATSNAALNANAEVRSNEAYLAYAFLSGANRKKYEKLLEDFQIHMPMTRMSIQRH